MSSRRQLFLSSVVVLWLSATACVALSLEASPANGNQGPSNFHVVSTLQCTQKPCQGCRGELKIERYCNCGRYHRVSLESMLSSLQVGVPVSIGVHGSFVNERDVHSMVETRRRQMTSVSGNRPIHFIAFHWPSGIGIPLCPGLQTNRLGKRAEFNGIRLAQLIRMIPAENPISLTGHSHGTRVVSSALHLLAGGNVVGYCVPENNASRRIRVVFGAAAIDSHWLSPGEKYGLALNRVECLLNLRTRRDLALAVYPLQDPSLHHALGQTGFRTRELHRMGDNQYKIREFDVTKYVGFRHAVAAYFPHDVIWQSMVPYVYFD